jgi:hypothetical protein
MPILVIIVIIYKHIEQPVPNIHDNMADVMDVDIHYVDDDRVDMDVEMHDIEVEADMDVEMHNMEVDAAMDMELDD